MVAVKSGSALQLFVPGVNAKSFPPLLIFISQTPADVPVGSAGTGRCQHPTIASGTVQVDAEASPPLRRMVAATAEAPATTTARDA
jgi:hypothetical protein